MGLARVVATDAGIQLAYRGSLELVASADVPRFLDAVQGKGLVVLGVEGFLIRREAVTPDMDAIATLSGGESGPENASRSVRAAREFVERVNKPGIYFEFELADYSTSTLR